MRGAARPLPHATAHRPLIRVVFASTRTSEAKGVLMQRIRVAAVVAGAAAVVVAGAGVAGLRDSSPASSARSCPKPQALPSSFAARVDNPWFPLVPGTTYTYKGKQDGEPSKDVLSVTHDTKTILGVATTVIHDQVLMKGKLVEDTFDWYAQDADGNVWYFGEDTRELDNGQVVSTEGSWQAGVNNANAGIFMPAHPTVGQSFKQEDAKGVAEDCTKIVALDASVKTPYVSSDASLKTEEFSLLEPGVLDNKYYVRSVGNVREQTIQGGNDELELISVSGP